MFKWLKRLLVALLILCALLAAGYVFRTPLLQAAARAWVVNDQLTRADVIVVLGGGNETRPFKAARLFHLGLGTKVLVMNPKPTPSAQLGLAPSDAVVARSMLLQKEVPEGDIFITADTVNSSYDESVAVRNWANTNHLEQIIIVTDVFHTRRVRWLFRKALGPTGIQVQVDAVPVREYTTNNWWQHEQGLIAFQNEIVKYTYYRAKY